VLELTNAVVAEGRDEPSGQFAILSDRTEVDRIERLARQAQRLEIVGTLAADFAHEINDPLTFVRANLMEIERLGERVDAEGHGPDRLLALELADLRSVAQETLEGVERMRRIVEGMRGLSIGNLQDVAEIDLAGVVRDAVRMLRLGDAARGPSLRLELDEVPPVRGNADKLMQVLVNLLMNARQALSERPSARIEVMLRRSGDEVEVSVRDNGPGIPAEVRDRIFDPFFTTRGPDEGTGLGLAIAFDIAREHGGVLEERASSGRGAWFVLRLPAAA
jgi:signal transduction histidine kinase